MEELINLYKKSGNLHHAYFLVGNREEINSNLLSFLEKKVGVKTNGNPDFWKGEFKTLNIEHARSLSFSQERKDFSGNKKIYIIKADFITEEAQNSLLKVFEEPTSGTHFFIISPQDMLLPTLRSRMQVLICDTTEEIHKAESILDLNINERLSRVKEIVDGISDEEKTKQDAIVFLNQIQTELHKKGTEKMSKSLLFCENTRSYLYDRGAPVKMILENLMINI